MTFNVGHRIHRKTFRSIAQLHPRRNHPYCYFSFHNECVAHLLVFLVWINPKNEASLCTIVVLRVLQITVSLFRQESNFIFNLLKSLRLLSLKQCVDVGTTKTIASKAPYPSKTSIMLATYVVVQCHQSIPMLHRSFGTITRTIE